MSFIAGKYDAIYGTDGAEITVGQISAGITIEHSVSKQLITGDNAGQTVQDAVYQGHNVFVEFTLMEYDQAGALDVFWPYDVLEGEQGVIGRLDTAVARSLQLDGLTGAPVPSATELQADLAILAEDFPVRILYAPALREIPVRMRLYPTGTAPSDSFYVLT